MLEPAAPYPRNAGTDAGNAATDGTFPIPGRVVQRPRSRSATASKRELALRLMRLHVGAQDGIDAGLIAALAAEPAQQVGIEPHGYCFFWRRQHHLGRFPECGIRGLRVRISGNPLADRSRRTATQARPVS